MTESVAFNEAESNRLRKKSPMSNFTVFEKQSNSTKTQFKFNFEIVHIFHCLPPLFVTHKNWPCDVVLNCCIYK